MRTANAGSGAQMKRPTLVHRVLLTVFFNLLTSGDHFVGLNELIDAFGVRVVLQPPSARHLMTKKEFKRNKALVLDL